MMAAAGEAERLNSYRNWAGFWVLGTINNLGYVVILSGAKSLAESFNAANLIGVINWALVGFGLVAKSSNAFLLENVRFSVRVAGTTLVFVAGLLLVALSVGVSFALSIIGILLVGAACSFGESLLLGFLKYYPSSMAGAWSSGTGMAGVGGSMFYLALATLGVGNRAIFLLMLPLMIAYFCTFVCGLAHPAAEPGRGGAAAVTSTQYGKLDTASDTDDDDLGEAGGAGTSHGDGNEGGRWQPGGVQAAAAADDDVRYGATARRVVGEGLQRGSFSVAARGHDAAAERNQVVALRAGGEAETRMQRVLRCSKLVLRYGLNLLFVYFFEYVVSVSFAAKANPAGASKAPGASFWMRESYPILAFCYQFGVLLSRSSLKVVRVRRVEFLSVLQGVNFVLWMIQAKLHVVGMGVEIVAMIYVGLLGGAMYVNVFALLVDDKRIPDEDRELCINIASLYNNLGIVTASLFEILIDQTWLKTA